MSNRRSFKDKTNDNSDASAADTSNTVYGLNPVLEMLRAGGKQLQQISISDAVRHERMKELLELAKQARIPIHRVPRNAIDRLLPGISHQGVVARVAAAKYSDADDLLDELASRVRDGRPPLVLGLDAVEDPRNLGAILRTAECAGVNGVFIPERRAVGLTETVAKAAAGATEHIKVAKVSNLNLLIKDLKARNIWVVGGSVDAGIDHTEWDWTRGSALVLGGEGRGLHRLVAENCDILVKIPMYGKIESLNVSVAAGVILFEARRQREVGSRQ